MLKVRCAVMNGTLEQARGVSEKSARRPNRRAGMPSRCETVSKQSVTCARRPDLIITGKGDLCGFWIIIGG
jgi:hypothetical protein